MLDNDALLICPQEFNDCKKWRRVGSLTFEFENDEITVDWPDTFSEGLIITSISKPAKVGTCKAASTLYYCMYFII